MTPPLYISYPPGTCPAVAAYRLAINTTLNLARRKRCWYVLRIRGGYATKNACTSAVGFCLQAVLYPT